MRRNRDHFVPGQGAGDLYSKPQKVDWPPKEPLALTLDRQAKEKTPRESGNIKYFSIKSKLLSDFHGREITLHAGVALPTGWSADSHETWPAVYFITGFGGDHQTANMFRRNGDDDDSAMSKVISIVPDPTNHWGHSVFADSANTGPWGRALTEELIPAIEKQFHGPAGASGATPQQAAARRFVTGISSGGWSSLWLQVAYPDTFAGCWSHSPDPVDFRDFQTINLYSPGVNMYTDEQGKPRPIARDSDHPILFYKSFVAMESALGPGGQVRSFEAVFSPKGADGEPRPLFDRATGAVDPQTAKAWEPYDITLKIRNEWKTLSPKLVGKLHVYAGSADNFYLNSAVEKLAATLKELDPDNTIKAEIKIISGMGHAIHYPAQGDLYKTAAKTAPKPSEKHDTEPALVK
ncbi:MAG: alpha/beta hydrolase-fold protein [Phycisphaerales bacterium]